MWTFSSNGGKILKSSIAAIYIDIVYLKIVHPVMMVRTEYIMYSLDVDMPL